MPLAADDENGLLVETVDQAVFLGDTAAPVAGEFVSEARVTIAGEPRKAMADQLTTISKLRLKERIGALAVSEMAAVERALAVQLGLKLPSLA